MYELLSGHRAFAGETIAAALTAAATTEPKPLDRVPERLDELVRLCLRKDPARRFQHMDDVKVELEELKQAGGGAATLVPHTSAKLWRIAIPVLLAVVLVAGGLYYRSHQTKPLTDKDSKVLSDFTSIPKIGSLAVLPLENLSGDPQQEYFADGMTEALIAELGQIGSLRVISRTSVMQYRGAKKPLPQIARELNVDAVIEGSVFRVGDRVRITAQLIGVGPERHLWARNYERNLRDVLSLQGEIARTIADEVKANVTPGAQARLASARPVNPEAHEAYLKGQFFFNKATKEDIQKATEYAQQAVQIDPNYAPAYGLLAESYWYSSQNAFGSLPDAEAAAKTKVAAMKALAIDDTLAEPHVALGDVLNFHEWDWAGSEREFKRAIELNPNSALAHAEYAWCLVDMGRQDESIREAKRAVELDPFSEDAIIGLTSMYYNWRQYDQALEQSRTWLEMFPNSLAAYIWLDRILEANGMYDQEVAARQKTMTIRGEKPEDVAASGRAYKVGGIRGAWRWDLERLERLPRDEDIATEIAIRYASLGEKDKALDWLEKGYEKHAPGMAQIKVDPRYDNLRSDPRFQDLLRRMKFPP